MTPEQFKTARKALGLTINALADAFQINKRTVRRWECGDFPIPGTAVLAMQYLSGVPYDPSRKPPSRRQDDHAEVFIDSMRQALVTRADNLEPA
jgi:transcriptional regulator with XRE-family HTH domain